MGVGILAINDMNPEVDRLAVDYLAEVVQGKDGDSGAFDRFVDLLERDTEAAWAVVCRLAEQPLTEHEIAVLGSVAIEDVLLRYPGIFVRKAAEEARRNSRFRKALFFVTIEEGEIPLELLKILAACQETAMP
jgi:hypothetical protein